MAIASDPGRRARFEREAHAISGLSHSNICALFDIGDQDGIHYVVLEYLEGGTLADRLTKGPLPVSEVLKVGAHIASALETAHRHGIVHRDLKPATVMLTKTGPAQGQKHSPTRPRRPRRRGPRSPKLQGVPV